MFIQIGVSYEARTLSLWQRFVTRLSALDGECRRKSCAPIRAEPNVGKGWVAPGTSYWLHHLIAYMARRCDPRLSGRVVCVRRDCSLSPPIASEHPDPDRPRFIRNPHPRPARLTMRLICSLPEKKINHLALIGYHPSALPAVTQLYSLGCDALCYSLPSHHFALPFHCLCFASSDVFRPTPTVTLCSACHLLRASAVQCHPCPIHNGRTATDSSS